MFGPAKEKPLILRDRPRSRHTDTCVHMKFDKSALSLVGRIGSEKSVRVKIRDCSVRSDMFSWRLYSSKAKGQRRKIKISRILIDIQFWSTLWRICVHIHSPIDVWELEMRGRTK